MMKSNVTKRPPVDWDDDTPLTEDEFQRGRMALHVRSIRKQTGLSQAEFARKFKLSLAIVRDWEQGRREPDRISKNYLRLIEKMPEDVSYVLRDAA